MSKANVVTKAIFILPVVLAALSVAEYYSWRSEQNRLGEILIETGIEREYPKAAAEVRLEPDRELARLRLARALLGAQLDTQRLGQYSPDEQRAELQDGIGDLELAAELALETLQQRPASWQAAFIFGAATYLADFRLGRLGLFSEKARWEEALLLASRLAPGQPEAPRFLASVYLGNWSRLSPQRRQVASDLISLAVLDNDSFRLLIEPWLRVAPSTQQAFDALPDRPEIWSRLDKIYRIADDLERLRDTQERWRAALISSSESALRDAQIRLRAGDTKRGIPKLLAILGMPPDNRLVGVVEEALEGIPEIHVGRRVSEHYATWLHWALDLCMARGCPMSLASVLSLHRTIVDPRPQDSATVSLLRGDLRRAEQYEMLADDLTAEAWQGYLSFKAATLAERDDTRKARETLDLLSGSVRTFVSQARAAKALEGTEERAQDGVLTPSGSPGPARWVPGSWRTTRNEAVLEMDVEEAAMGLELRLGTLRDTGDVIEVQLDGNHLGYFVVRGTTTLSPRVEIEPGYHLLRLLAVQGRFAPTGEVDLLRPAVASP